MGACARNMQSDPAEIKPAQCCIKLVFHSTYTATHGSTQHSTYTATHGSTQHSTDTVTHGSTQHSTDTVTHGSTQHSTYTVMHGSTQHSTDTVTHGSTQHYTVLCVFRRLAFEYLHIAIKILILILRTVGVCCEFFYIS